MHFHVDFHKKSTSDQPATKKQADRLHYTTSAKISMKLHHIINGSYCRHLNGLKIQ